MTTHKDRPHDLWCWYRVDVLRGFEPQRECSCLSGTRWFGIGKDYGGARAADAIAIQGIATFFARLQSAYAYAYRFRLAGEHDDFEDITLRRHRAISADAVFGMRGHDFSNDAQTSEIELYASPVTPAAYPFFVTVPSGDVYAPSGESWKEIARAAQARDGN